jgi:hypothetical protein
MPQNSLWKHEFKKEALSLKMQLRKITEAVQGAFRSPVWLPKCALRPRIRMLHLGSELDKAASISSINLAHF